MSNFYLCMLCKHQHTKLTDYKWTELCDAGEEEPKVMSGGENPTDVCRHFVKRTKE